MATIFDTLFGGSSSTTSTSYPSQVTNAVSGLLGNAANLAAQPYPAYTPSVAASYSGYVPGLVAQMNPNEIAAGNEISSLQNYTQPFFQSATGLVNDSATPIQLQQYGQNAINQYMSPYLNNVVDSAVQNINNTNAQQQQQVLGNAIQKGAFGGDRAGIAQAELARQQNLSNNATISNLLNQGFTQAQGEFNNQQLMAAQTDAQNRQLAANAATNLANLGTQGQAAALQQANAQYGYGSAQQQQQQANLSTAYQQFLNKQGYPYQQLGYLSQILAGNAPSLGTSTTQTGASVNPVSGTLGMLGTLGMISNPQSSNYYQAIGNGVSSVGNLFSNMFGFKKGGRVGYAGGGDVKAAYDEYAAIASDPRATQEQLNAAYQNYLDSFSGTPAPWEKGAPDSYIPAPLSSGSGNQSTPSSTPSPTAASASSAAASKAAPSGEAGGTSGGSNMEATSRDPRTTQMGPEGVANPNSGNFLGLSNQQLAQLGGGAIGGVFAGIPGAVGGANFGKWAYDKFAPSNAAKQEQPASPAAEPESTMGSDASAYAGGQQSNVGTLADVAKQRADQIAQDNAALTMGVNPSLLGAISANETSGYSDPNNTPGDKGAALGQFQLQNPAASDAAANLGASYNSSDRSDPTKASVLAQEHLAGLYDATGSVQGALAAYNMGLGAYKQAVANGLDPNSFSYVQKAMSSGLIDPNQPITHPSYSPIAGQVAPAGLTFGSGNQGNYQNQNVNPNVTGINVATGEVNAPGLAGAGGLTFGNPNIGSYNDPNANPNATGTSFSLGNAGGSTTPTQTDTGTAGSNVGPIAGDSGIGGQVGQTMYERGGLVHNHYASGGITPVSMQYGLATEDDLRTAAENEAGSGVAQLPGTAEALVTKGLIPGEKTGGRIHAQTGAAIPTDDSMWSDDTTPQYGPESAESMSDYLRRQIGLYPYGQTHFAAGSDAQYTMPDVGLRMGKSDTPAIVEAAPTEAEKAASQMGSEKAYDVTRDVFHGLGESPEDKTARALRIAEDRRRREQAAPDVPDYAGDRAYRAANAPAPVAAPKATAAAATAAATADAGTGASKIEPVVPQADDTAQNAPVQVAQNYNTNTMSDAGGYLPSDQKRYVTATGPQYRAEEPADPRSLAMLQFFSRLSGTPGGLAYGIMAAGDAYAKTLTAQQEQQRQMMTAQSAANAQYAGANFEDVQRAKAANESTLAGTKVYGIGPDGQPTVTLLPPLQPGQSVVNGKIVGGQGGGQFTQLPTLPGGPLAGDETGESKAAQLKALSQNNIAGADPTTVSAYNKIYTDQFADAQAKASAAGYDKKNINETAKVIAQIPTSGPLAAGKGAGLAYNTAAYLQSAANRFGIDLGLSENASLPQILDKIRTIKAEGYTGAQRTAAVWLQKLADANPGIELQPETSNAILAQYMLDNQRALDFANHMQNVGEVNPTAINGAVSFNKMYGNTYRQEQNALQNLLRVNPNRGSSVISEAIAGTISRQQFNDIVQGAIANKSIPPVKNLDRYIYGD